MALTRILYLNTRSQDSAIAKIKDTTVYGTPEINRNQEAHFMVIAKMDENEQLTFIIGIDNTDPLNALEYQFNETKDGAYRFIQFNPLFYNAATLYIGETFNANNVLLTYANIIYQPVDGKFYKAIFSTTTFSAISPGVTVGWATYWAQITDFTTQVSNNVLDKFISNDIITFRYEDCLLAALDSINDDILCGVCATYEGLFTVLAMQLQLDGINSLNWQNKQLKAETDIVESAKKFCC